MKTIRKLKISKYISSIKYAFLNYFDEKYPFYASFKVTSRCPFRCKFCDMYLYQNPDLSEEDCIKIIRNLGKSSIFLLSLEGGEPLLRKDIEKLLIEAHKQPFYLLFTTSQRNLLDYPWDRYEKYIDFLHISIDEGHRNLELFDILPEINQYNMIVCVQTVVAEEDRPFLEDKVKKCYDSGCRILIMPAVHLDGTKNYFPNFDEFEKDVLRLKRKYPRTIITPNSYFRQVKKTSGGCSPSSIIINSDGELFYPCRTLLRKAVKLQGVDLMTFLVSEEAKNAREVMYRCKRRCGWYQYFATSRFSSLSDIVDAASPYLREFFR
jgi:MoaA/NifB/PqqE/SkfB family radical SAM enzyme